MKDALNFDVKFKNTQAGTRPKKSQMQPTLFFE